MIDRVQQILEDLAPELNSYLKRNLFSEKEISKIIDTRRSFEQKLMRNTKKLDYYLDYIDSELKLEKIRNNRILKYNLFPVETDKLLEKNILTIYQRGLAHFVDIPIMRGFVDFCISRGFQDEMKASFKKLSLNHIDNPDLWFFFSQTLWEINDVSAARNILLQYISLNKYKNKTLVELFRLECLYTEKLVRTKNELGIDDSEKLPGEKGESALIVFKNILELGKSNINECIEISKIMPEIHTEVLKLINTNN